jgi:hypothetical protein
MTAHQQQQQGRRCRPSAGDGPHIAKMKQMLMEQHHRSISSGSSSSSSLTATSTTPSSNDTFHHAPRKVGTVRSKSTFTTTVADAAVADNKNYNHDNCENSCPNVNASKQSSSTTDDYSSSSKIYNKMGRIINEPRGTTPLRSPLSPTRPSPSSLQSTNNTVGLGGGCNIPLKCRESVVTTSSSEQYCITSQCAKATTITTTCTASAAEQKQSTTYLKQQDCSTKENRRRLLLRERQLRSASQNSNASTTRLFFTAESDGVEQHVDTTTGREIDVCTKAHRIREKELLIILSESSRTATTNNATSTKAKIANAPPLSARLHHPPPISLLPSSSSQCSSKKDQNNIHCFLAFISHIILLILILFEVQDYYNLGQLGTIFDFISIMTESVDIFHIGFVFAFGTRGLFSAWEITMDKRREWHQTQLRAKMKRNSKDITNSNVCSRVMFVLQLVFYFIVVALFWLSLLPMFKDCRGSDANSNTNKFCFFIQRRVIKGRIPRRTFHISSPRYSTLELLVRYMIKKSKFVLKSKIQGRLMREILLAVLRPLAFRGRLRKLFKIIRWANFLAPLFGTCNKFRGHVLDMTQRRRQHNASKAARKRWNELIDAYSQQSKLERAVRAIQRRYLEQRECKVKRRYALMAPRRESSNLKVACKIRRRLVEEERSSRSRLDRMEILDGQRKMLSQVSLVERENISQHQESERKLKRRLLLSPKTSFAVGWKYFAVVCVALEISSHLFAPLLSGELKKMPLYEFIVRVLNAPVPKCSDKGGRRISASSMMFIPMMIDNSLGDFTCVSSPWERRWLVTAHLFATLLVPMVNTIFFLDVFITFFTGELSSSGTLIPKPLFERYIFPGIGLQLIVNPTMASISQLVKRTIGHATVVGPSLFCHLLLASVPFAAYCYDCILDMVFDFVERQNKVISRR